MKRINILFEKNADSLNAVANGIISNG